MSILDGSYNIIRLLQKLNKIFQIKNPSLDPARKHIQWTPAVITTLLVLNILSTCSCYYYILHSYFAVSEHNWRQELTKRKTLMITSRNYSFTKPLAVIAQAIKRKAKDSSITFAESNTTASGGSHMLLPYEFILHTAATFTESIMILRVLLSASGFLLILPRVPYVKLDRPYVVYRSFRHESTKYWIT